MKRFFAITSIVAVCILGIIEINYLRVKWDKSEESVANKLESGNIEKIRLNPEQFKDLKILAKRNNLKAKYWLGYCYLYGKGTLKDYKNAIKWLTKSARKGYADSQYMLGICYEYGKGAEIDFNAAIDWYKQAFEQGHADAPYRIGWCFETGRGVKYDCYKAIEWYAKASEQGHVDAPYRIAMLYETGRGVKQDSLQANEWYIKAIKNRGHIDLDDLSWYKRPAEFGVALAQYYLGRCYEGMEPAFDEIAAMYSKYAGSFDQMIDKGDHIAKGYKAIYGFQKSKDRDKIAENYSRAVYWYTKAAEQGYADAQYQLGLCYYEGRGVKQNYKKAVEWWLKAAEQNHSSSQDRLSNCYASGQGVQQSWEKSQYWSRREIDTRLNGYDNQVDYGNKDDKRAVH